jgi:hypothetical protein
MLISLKRRAASQTLYLVADQSEFQKGGGKLVSQSFLGVRLL